MDLTHTYYDPANSGLADSLKMGEEFQDHVCLHLAERHFIIQNTVSRRYQKNWGENLQKAEIKYDGNFRQTKRLSIEVAKKWKKEDEWVPSGIYSECIFYIQGDFDGFAMFSARQLRLIHEERLKNGYLDVERDTIKTFYLDLKDGS